MVGSASIFALSPAHIILLAIHYTSSSDVESIIALRSVHARVLTPPITLRVLLLLPESLDPSVYIPLINTILGGPQAYTQDARQYGTRLKSDIDISPVQDLSEKVAQNQYIRLLNGIPTLEGVIDGSGHNAEVTQWLLIRARNIDTETGMLSLVQELLLPFIERLPKVAAYFAGTVQVLSRLVYDFNISGEQYLNGDGTHHVLGQGSKQGKGLVQFEALPVSSAVKYLLAQTSNESVVRDILTLVSPYLRFREASVRLEGWRVVWEWLVNRDLRTIYEVYMNWDGPQGTEEGDDISMREYASTGMAACYLCRNVNTEQWDMMKKIQGKFVDILGLREIQPGVVSHQFEKSLYVGDVKMKPSVKDLLSSDNMLTAPTLQSLDLLGYLISAASILSLPLYSTAQVRISGTKEEQKTLLTRYVRQGNWVKRTDQEWKHVIDASRWMRSPAGIFEHLTEQECEEALLRGLLSAAKFKMVEDIYVRDPNYKRAIGVKRLEEVVLESFQEFYDNASNGNMTRGGMKNAHHALQILYPIHSKSLALTRAHRLLQATHALSFYSLILTPGVPLLPVQIRINPDPVSLIGRLLDQNHTLYLQLDKLVTLAKDLHYGIVPIKSRSLIEEREEDEQVELRVLGMCIESALAEDDFDTAYSLTKSRLKTPEGQSSIIHKDGDNSQKDESAWKACFQAGRYRSHRPPRKEDDHLKRLEMQMELLAEALRSCPPVACNQVLSEWLRKEEEMTSVLVREAEEDEAHAQGLTRIKGMGETTGGWNTSSSLGSSVPSSSVGESEAPMGLLAVAAGAAKALGSTVRPLGVPRPSTGTPKPGGKSGLPDSPPSSTQSMTGSPQQQRRKRDILTSGLASGIGWVLGAQPVVPSSSPPRK